MTPMMKSLKRRIRELTAELKTIEAEQRAFDEMCAARVNRANEAQLLRVELNALEAAVGLVEGTHVAAAWGVYKPAKKVTVGDCVVAVTDH